MLRVLVTGVGGFVGKHLLGELKSRGCEVIGVGHGAETHPIINELADTYVACDLTDKAQVEALDINNVDAVINLAGLAKVGASFGAEELYRDVNVGILENLGKHLLLNSPRARLIAVSTGAVYNSEQSMPLTESSSVIHSGSPYALSKLSMEMAARELRDLGLDCIIVRPFNHTGPGQSPGFLIPDLYEKLDNFKKTGNPIRVGSLFTKRDYTDVRDIVKAYADLAVSESLEYDLYNVCSGNSRSGQEILEIMQEIMGVEDIKIEVDQALMRPNDPEDLYGDSSRLRDETGWEPKIPFQQTIHDFANSRQVN